MKDLKKNPRTINTDAPVKNDGVPRLPHERDASPDNQAPDQRKKMKQAYDDIERGLVDTDLHGERGVETTKKNPTSIDADVKSKGSIGSKRRDGK